MADESIEEVREETTQILSETVAKLTRRALKPELQPFKDTLEGLNSELIENVEEIERECERHRERIDTTSTFVEEAADDFQLNIGEFKEELKKLRKQDRELVEMLESRLDGAIEEWEQTVRVLRSDEQRQALKRCAEQLQERSDAIEQAYDRRGKKFAEGVKELKELAGELIEHTQQFEEIATNLDKRAGTLTDRLEESLESAVSSIDSKFQEQERELKERSSERRQEFQSLKSQVEQIASQLDGQKSEQKQLAEDLEQTQTSLMEISEDTSQLEDTQSEVARLQAMIEYQQKLTFGSLLLLVCTVVFSVIAVL